MARASTFTSYINAELPSDLETKWKRYESIATRTYGNIAKSATDANRAIAGLQGGRGTAGAGVGQSKALADATARQAAQLKAINTVNRQVEQSSSRTAASIDKQSRSTARASTETSRFSKNLGALSSSLTIVQGPLGPLAGRVRALGTAITELTGFRLGLAGVAASLFVIGRVGNNYQQLEARLRGAFIEQSDVNHAMSDIVGIARAARTGLEPVSDLYIRLAKSADQFGISQERARKITETVTKAAVLSGGSKQSQEAGIYQFAQAFGSGNLGGDELRSVKENTFALAQAIAQGLGTTVGQLKVLATQGKLTTEVVADALEKSAREIDARFSAMPKTLQQATTELTNSFTIMVGQFDQTIGLTSKLSGFISSLAGSLKFLATAAVGVAVGFAATKIGAFTKQLIDAAAAPRAMVAHLKELAAADAVTAQATVESAQRSIAALKAYEAELNELMATETRRANLAITDQNRADTEPARLAAIQEEKAALIALAAARSDAAVTANALAAAEQRLAVAQEEVASATAVATARSSSFGTAIRGVVGAVFSFGNIVTVLVTALIYLATRTSETQKVLGSFAEETVDAARKAIGLAQANGQLADSYYAIARAMGRKAAAEAKESRDKVAGEAAGTLRELATRAYSGVGAIKNVPAAERDAVGAQLKDFATQAEHGTLAAGVLEQKLDEIRKKYPGLIPGKEPLGGIFSTIGLASPVSDKAVTDQVTALYLSQQKLNNALQDQKQIEKDIAADRARVAAPKGATGGGAVSASSLRDKAAVDAIDSGTSGIAAAGRRRKQALDELNAQYVQNGKVSGENAQAYRDKAAEIQRTYDTEVEGVRSAAKARTAAAREAHAAAVQAVRDGREEAKLELDKGMLALEQQKPQMTEEAYYNERQKLLKTYDDEIQKVDAAGEHSSKAIEGLIADTRKLQQLAETRSQKRTDILDSYADQPSALRKANAQIADLNKMVGTFIEDASGKLVLYSQDQANADAARILEGVEKPLAQAADEAQRFQQIASLRLDGYDLVADALTKALSLQDQIGRLTAEQFDDIVGQTEQEQRINALLEQRQRLVQPIIDSVTAERDAFEQMLVDFPSKGFKSVNDFLKTLPAQIERLWARKVTETLFGGAEQKVKDLLGGSKSGVDAAYQFLAQHAKSSGDQLDKVGTSADTASSALDRLATAADGAAKAQPGGVGGSAENTITDIVNKTGTEAAAKAVTAVVGAAGATADVGANNEIVVTGQKQAPLVPQRTTQKSSSTIGLKELGDEFGGALDKVFGTKFFSKLGDVGVGAAKGAAASQILGSITGIQQSGAGAAIGGAIGSLIPIPGGEIIGGLIGGTIGGLFKKAKSGRVTLGSGTPVIGGTNTQLAQQAGATGDQITSTLQDIADQLGGVVGNFGAITLGVRDGNYRVNVGGSGTGSLKLSAGAKDFGQDEQAAIEYAIEQAVAGGAIEGISAASKRILASGQDLTKAIEKAVAIESIPKRLKAYLDPVGAAVDDVNDEFTKLISYLKEGGASAEQFSQAEQLYELERKDAIDQALNGAVDQLSEFLENMFASSSSPLNKRTIYENAQKTLQDYASQIAAGQSVDEQKLIAAATNFQDASRTLYGSSESFFQDFNYLATLLDQARTNILSTGSDPNDPTSLAPSPFSTDSSVQALIDQYRGTTAAIETQTTQVTDLLGQIRDGIYAQQTITPTSGTYLLSSIGALPGFSA